MKVDKDYNRTSNNELITLCLHNNRHPFIETVKIRPKILQLEFVILSLIMILYLILLIFYHFVTVVDILSLLFRLKGIFLASTYIKESNVYC